MHHSLQTAIKYIYIKKSKLALASWCYFECPGLIFILIAIKINHFDCLGLKMTLNGIKTNETILAPH